MKIRNTIPKEAATSKSFSLLELMIVVIIIALVYGFTLSSFHFSLTPKAKISLLNARSLLLSQTFSNETSLKCLEDSDKCLLIVDNKVIKKIPTLFDTDGPPRAYGYSNDYEDITFDDYQIDEFDSKPVIFDLTLTKSGLKQEMIVEYDQKVYIFNSLYEIPIIVKDISSVDEHFTNIINEVKEAF